MERHIQTAIQVVLVGLLLWIGNTTVETRDAVTELRAQMAEAREQIREMNQRFDRYLLRSEAEALFQAQDIRIKENSRRLEVIEGHRQ